MDYSFLSREEQYEHIQNTYIRFNQNPIQSIQTIDTVATIKEIIPVQVIDSSIETLNENTIICDICGGRYSHFNKNRHLSTKKHKNSITPLSFPPSQLKSPLLIEEDINP